MRSGLAASRGLRSCVPPRALLGVAPRSRRPAGIAACLPGTRKTLASNSVQQKCAHICVQLVAESGAGHMVLHPVSGMRVCWLARNLCVPARMFACERTAGVCGAGLARERGLCEGEKSPSPMGGEGAFCSPQIMVVKNDPFPSSTYGCSIRPGRSIGSRGIFKFSSGSRAVNTTLVTMTRCEAKGLTWSYYAERCPSKVNADPMHRNGVGVTKTLHQPCGAANSSAWSRSVGLVADEAACHSSPSLRYSPISF